MPQISPKLRSEVSALAPTHPERAAIVGVSPRQLSFLLNGLTRIREHDRRVHRLADVTGVPYDEAFAYADSNTPEAA